MSDLTEREDEELLVLGRDALKLKRYSQAAEYLLEYCDRLTKKGTIVPGGVLASYGVALGHTQRLREGMAVCLNGVASDRRNPHVYWCLAELHVLAGSRKKALEAVDRGLSLSPGHPGLVRLRKELGVRQGTPIPFLSRASGVNVRLGRILHSLRAKSGQRLTSA
jgi:hypothetical protein